MQVVILGQTLVLVSQLVIARRAGRAAERIQVRGDAVAEPDGTAGVLGAGLGVMAIWPNVIVLRVTRMNSAFLPLASLKAIL